MQAVHESGHVLGAWVTGGRVERVVLHPLTISRTDLAENPQPLVVVWAGPVVGAVLPLVMWGIVAGLRFRVAFLFRFFAGFCLLANGLYIGLGTFAGVGDCGEMLHHGSQLWQLWLFGACTAPLGLALWQGQGVHFGFGASKRPVEGGIAYAALLIGIVLVIIGLAHG